MDDHDLNDPSKSWEWDRRVNAELRKLHFGFWQTVYFSAQRVVVRTLRIVAGTAMALIAFWLGREALEILDDPFATLSPLDLAKGIVAGLGALFLFLGALNTAFGYGVTKDEAEEQWRNTQRKIVEKQLREDSQS